MPVMDLISPVSSPTLKHAQKLSTTFQYQDTLPKLPIPDLEVTCEKYLQVLKPLQLPVEHEETIQAVHDFLENDGPELQKKLHSYATDKSSYIEEFWYDSYLQCTDPVVLNLNPFFLLEDDPTPQRNNQIIRASSLIYSTLEFIVALTSETLEPEIFRGVPLDMSQFNRLFGTARIPTKNGCYIAPFNSNHIVVLAHSQFYHFDVLIDNQIILSEKEITTNLRAILKDAQQQQHTAVPVGVLTAENRQNWAMLREELLIDKTNADALSVIDSALFIVCLDHVEPTDMNESSTNMLCGTYRLENGIQVGTCTNRWYDKLQIIVCNNGNAGINFEHTGVDGHTVLRYVSDIYTDTILRFAKTIHSQTQSIFSTNLTLETNRFDTNPRKIEWNMTETLDLGIRYAETRLSDLVLQNEIKVLEYKKYGKHFITDMKMSPDAFVQMAIQAAYFGLYGTCECTYEPVMTKTFLHGRTEAIRTVSEASVEFVKIFYDKSATTQDKLAALRNSLGYHKKLTKACSLGFGQDRHLYALECVWDRIHQTMKKKPKIFKDDGWRRLNHSVISTSNCGNPALRLFGFGPVVSNGFGIGYIIKDDGITFVASSKHRQTQRLLDVLNQYLMDIQSLLLKEKGISLKQYVNDDKKVGKLLVLDDTDI